MYAVIEAGGKQYRVQPGDIVQIEKVEGDVGSPFKFGNVLMVGKPGNDSTQIWLGKPFLNGAAIEAEIVGQGRGEKILIVKMKRRKQYRRTQGHRQFYTQLLVTALDNGAGEKMNLSSDDKKVKLAKFQSHLAPKGPAMTPKTLGSRVRMARARAALGKDGAAAAKAAAPKKAEAAPNAAAAKKAPAKKKAE
ncbi:MAG: 50S ribosomal protein L21 [Methylotenera sp.]|nr:50S ribosomal protein L21 [Oligoflexia bacterium]